MKRPIVMATAIYEIPYKSFKSLDGYVKLSEEERELLQQVPLYLLRGALKEILERKVVAERLVENDQKVVEERQKVVGRYSYSEPTALFERRIKDAQTQYSELVKRYVKNINHYDQIVRDKLRVSQEKRQAYSLGITLVQKDPIEPWSKSNPAIYLVLTSLVEELEQKGWSPSLELVYDSSKDTKSVFIKCNFTEL